MGGVETLTGTLRLETGAIPPSDRFRRWREIIDRTYFPLDTRVRRTDCFRGAISSFSFGRIGLSRVMSDAACYERGRHHIREAGDDDFLVTIPVRGVLRFGQLGRELTCVPGAFLIERGDEPYRLASEEANDLIVLKVDRKTLAERVVRPSAGCEQVHDASTGAGRLFVSMVAHAQQQSDTLSETARKTVGRQLMELLALSLDAGGDAALGRSSPVRQAHMTRVESFVGRNLENPELTPDLIAAACGISKRYLQDLFKDVGGTARDLIRERRLIAARDFLATTPNISISEVAYRFGFADQAQFARLFRSRFGLRPSDCRGRPDAA